MAAESLEATAKQLNHDIHVEIQGSMGAENELPRETITDADVAIIAADTAVSRDRFEAAGVPVVKATVKAAINDPKSLFDRARESAGGDESEDKGTVETDTTETDDASEEPAEGELKHDLETQADGATPDAEQIGGDPRKGLFARLKRMFS